MMLVKKTISLDFVIFCVPVGVVSVAAVFRVVTLRSYPPGKERCVKTLKTEWEN